MRFARGLTLGLSLSVLNLAGMFLMLMLLGGLGAWTPKQFVGIFGTFEIATGLAFLFCPNAWRLPVIEVETAGSDVRLSASTLFLPHWAGGVKSLAGLPMVVYAAADYGADIATTLLVPFVIAVAVLTVTASVAAAAWGVRNPSLDVVYFRIERPQRPDLAIPGISVSAATLQIVLSAFTLPTIKLLEPSEFFRPEMGPSTPMLILTMAVTLLSIAIALFAWRGRISFRAPREQQELAEQPA